MDDYSGEWMKTGERPELLASNSDAFHGLERNIKGEQRHQHILELQGHLDTKITHRPNWRSLKIGNYPWLTFTFVLSTIWKLTKGFLLSSRTFLKLLQSNGN